MIEVSEAGDVSHRLVVVGDDRHLATDFVVAHTRNYTGKLSG